MTFEHLLGYVQVKQDSHCWLSTTKVTLKCHHHFPHERVWSTTVLSLCTGKFSYSHAGTSNIQSISGSVIGEGLELSCTFANRSQTQSCILSVCRLENVNHRGSCINVTIPRDNHSLTSSEQLTNLSPGQYVVSLVGQMDYCRVTILRTVTVSIILRISGTMLATNSL